MTILKNTKTSIRIEYSGFGKKSDGSYRQLFPTKTIRTIAEEELEEYQKNVKRNPKIYIAYEDYKVMSRRTITTTEEWEYEE